MSFECHRIVQNIADRMWNPAFAAFKLKIFTVLFLFFSLIFHLRSTFSIGSKSLKNIEFEKKTLSNKVDFALTFPLQFLQQGKESLLWVQLVLSNTPKIFCNGNKSLEKYLSRMCCTQPHGCTKYMVKTAMINWFPNRRIKKETTFKHSWISSKYQRVDFSLSGKGIICE